MATEQNQNGDQEVASSSTLSWSGSVVKKFRDLKGNAEAYPYVWGSYILVYGGFGLYMIYRWRKLRRTEDNVRVLQQRLKDLVESEESAIAAGLLEKETPSSASSVKKLLSSKATGVENPPHSAPSNVEK